MANDMSDLNITHVSSNLAQQVGLRAGQPTFSHALNFPPFS